MGGGGGAVPLLGGFMRQNLCSCVAKMHTVTCKQNQTSINILLQRTEIKR